MREDGRIDPPQVCQALVAVRELKLEHINLVGEEYTK
jgi:hypothetical protein